MAQPRKHPLHATADGDAGDARPQPPSLRIVGMPSQQDDTLLSLTRRECQCLGWCAEGKSYWETAVILGISERTVSFHMEAVRGKLHAGSNAHAVAIAAYAGLLEMASGTASTPRRGLR